MNVRTVVTCAKDTLLIVNRAALVVQIEAVALLPRFINIFYNYLYDCIGVISIYSRTTHYLDILVDIVRGVYKATLHN